MMSASLRTRSVITSFMRDDGSYGARDPKERREARLHQRPRGRRTGFAARHGARGPPPPAKHLGHMHPVIARLCALAPQVEILPPRQTRVGRVAAELQQPLAPN